MPGLAFVTLSLVRVQPRRSVPMRVEQVVRSDAEQAASKATAARRKPTPSTATRRPGRPKGSKHTPTVPLTPELVRLPGLLGALRPWIAGGVPLTSVLLDGHCGHHHARPMARQHTLPRMSTRRCDAALSFPSIGP